MLYIGIYCDYCGSRLETKSTASGPLPCKTDVVRQARERGWTVGRVVKCPYCQKNKDAK